MTQNFAQDLFAILGKKIDDPELTSFLQTLDASTAFGLKDEYADEPQWVSKKAGMGVYSKHDTHLIWLVAVFDGGFGGYKRYNGALPKGIQFGMTKEQVKACLSRDPDQDGGGECIWNFDGWRLMVDFFNDDASASNVRLAADLYARPTSG